MTTIFLSLKRLFLQIVPSIVSLLILCVFFTTSYAQEYKGLDSLKGYKTQTYYSTGSVLKAKKMARQLDDVMNFYKEHLLFNPEVTLLILSQADWSRFTKMPVYGMPHYTSNKTLIVAADDNSHWRGYIPPEDKTPAAYAQLVKDTYTDKKGGLTMEPFFDLLAIHELGHAYYNQDSLSGQRRWLTELFCNILLHTYIAEKAPQLLPALATFPEMVTATTNRASLKYTTLEQLETHYNDIGPNHPENYGWYQCRWHIAAGKIYDEMKIDGVKKLRFALKKQKKILTDPELVDFLKTNVGASVADVLLKWDDEL